MKKLFFFFFFLLLVSGCKKNINNSDLAQHIFISPVVYTDSGYDIKISLSKNYSFIGFGPKLFTGSRWIDAGYLKSKLFNKFYYSGFDNKRVLYYDEVSGRRAGLIVFILRDILGYKNISLGLFSNSKMIKCKNCKSLDINGDYKIDISGGFLGTGKYFVVIDPNKIHFSSGDLLVYISDGGTMKQDSFYKKFSGDVKNLYWPYLIDFDGKFKSRKQIENLLKRNDIDFSKYNRVFFYYPKYWWRSGIVALYFSEIFK